MNDAPERDFSDPDFPVSPNSVLATKGRSFHWARHLLGAPHSTRATRLYRLCRYIDDLADESCSNIEAKDALANVVASVRIGQSKDLIIQDGLSLMQECGIEADVLFDLIEGVHSDLELVRIPDMESLLRYCYQVAGTVGIMMCKVLDTNVREAFPHAVDLGIAMQLINISRDIYEDSLRNRIYLPESLIGKYTPKEIANPTKETAAQIDLARKKIIHLANIYFASASQAIHSLPRGTALAVKLASALYQQIGHQLIHTHYQHKEKRCYVNNFSKLLITLKIITKFLITFKGNLKAHNKKLHKFIFTLPDGHF